MKHLIKYSILAIGLVCPTYTYSEHFPYVGLEIQERYFNFDEELGGNCLKNHMPQGDAYIGIRVTDNFAIEAGYEETAKIRRTVTVTAGKPINGTPLPEELAPSVFRNTFKVHGPHLDLLYFRRIQENTELFISGGISFLKSEATMKSIVISGDIPHNVTRTMCGRRSVPRFSCGIQYSFSENLSIRGRIGYSGTKNVKVSLDDNVPSIYKTEIKTGSSTFLGLGLILRF